MQGKGEHINVCMHNEQWVRGWGRVSKNVLHKGEGQENF